MSIKEKEEDTSLDGTRWYRIWHAPYHILIIVLLLPWIEIEPKEFFMTECIIACACVNPLPPPTTASK